MIAHRARTARIPLACLSIAFTALALAGCSGEKGGYPSLARRPAERIAGAPLPPCADDGKGNCKACEEGRMTGSAMPVAASADSPGPQPVAEPAMADPGTQSRLAALLAQAHAAHDRFRSKQGGAERAISAAAGGSVASDAWSTAAIALADLESARNDASEALSAIDSIYAEDSIAHSEAPGPDSAAIADAHGQAASLVAQEDAVLARLRPRLPG